MTIRWVGILALVLSASACGGGGPSQGMDAPGEDGNDQVSSADGAGEDLAAADAGEDGGVICPGGKLCDDDLPCTRDLCREDGACDHELRPGFCLIDGACLEDGEESPEEACLECITAVATEAWTPDDTNGCDDGDPCTVQDRCEGGLCTGTPVACPGDGNPCTAAACQQGACSQVPVDGPCDDGDPCTVGEACADGTCLGGAPPDCGDGNPCTEDSCAPGAGCVHPAVGGACDDGNVCTVGDACAGGDCVPGTGTPDCGDGNPCTDDSCHPELGCMHFPNATPCDDGEPCQQQDFCVGGVCQPGPLGLACDDGNVCTDDSCQPGAGCVTIPNTVPCDDGDVCFSGDLCQGGSCHPGSQALACDDGNWCTDDYCEAFSGCQAVPNSLPCNDLSVCTLGDTCDGGTCDGTLISCEDGNPCTTDTCHPVTGCAHEASLTPECLPDIVVTWPPRGATLNAPGPVTVTGTVSSLGGPITGFQLNGAEVPLGAGGSFSMPIPPHQGMNLLVFEAEDVLGATTRSSRAFYWSRKWYQPDSPDPAKAMVKDGIMIFLGPQVWDDNDTSDVDDLATIMTFYLGTLNLGTLITNPVTTGTFGWCSYKVNVSNITYGSPSVDLVPINGGLHMYVLIPAFKADIAVDMSGFACPDLNGDATASSITISTDVMLSVDAAGTVIAQMQGAEVTVNDLDITLGGIWGFLLNWLINFFEGAFADQIEAAFEQQLGALIEDTLAEALGSLALDESISMAPFLGEGPPVTLQISTGVSSLAFSPQGGVLGLRAKVTAAKAISHNPLGSIGRDACGGGAEPGLAFPMLGQIEMALHDDFFNQLPFAMYWGGLFSMPVDPATLGADLSQYGLDDVLLTLDFLLPPILTKCTPDGALVIQIGDLRVDGVLDLYGLPVEMTMYASTEVAADLVVVDGATGKELSIALGEVRAMEVEITELTGALAGAEDVLVALVEEQLIGGLLDGLAGDALGSFPIPAIDLSGMLPGLPAGTSISIDIKTLLRILGYTVLSGDVK